MPTAERQDTGHAVALRPSLPHFISSCSLPPFSFACRSFLQTHVEARIRDAMCCIQSVRKSQSPNEFSCRCPDHCVSAMTVAIVMGPSSRHGKTKHCKGGFDEGKKKKKGNSNILGRVSRAVGMILMTARQTCRRCSSAPRTDHSRKQSPPSNLPRIATSMLSLRGMPRNATQRRPHGKRCSHHASSMDEAWNVGCHFLFRLRTIRISFWSMNMNRTAAKRRSSCLRFAPRLAKHSPRLEYSPFIVIRVASFVMSSPPVPKVVAKNCGCRHTALFGCTQRPFSTATRFLRSATSPSLAFDE